MKGIHDSTRHQTNVWIEIHADTRIDTANQKIEHENFKIN